jgi:hypothetical protein
VSRRPAGADNFVKLRRSLDEHLLFRRMTWNQFAMFVWLCLRANPANGVVRTSWTQLQSETRLSANHAEQICRALQRKRYVWYPWHRGRHGAHRVIELAINKYPTADGRYTDLSDRFAGGVGGASPSRSSSGRADVPAALPTRPGSVPRRTVTFPAELAPDRARPAPARTKRGRDRARGEPIQTERGRASAGRASMRSAVGREGARGMSTRSAVEREGARGMSTRSAVDREGARRAPISTERGPDGARGVSTRSEVGADRVSGVPIGTELARDRTPRVGTPTELGPDRARRVSIRTELGPDDARRRTELARTDRAVEPHAAPREIRRSSRLARGLDTPAPTELGPDRARRGSLATEVGPDRRRGGSLATELDPDRIRHAPIRTELDLKTLEESRSSTSGRLRNRRERDREEDGDGDPECARAQDRRNGRDRMEARARIDEREQLDRHDAALERREDMAFPVAIGKLLAAQSWWRPPPHVEATAAGADAGGRSAGSRVAATSGSPPDGAAR